MSIESKGVADGGPAEQSVELSLTVVRYADGPDRCTIYPPNATGDARMATWLTADRAAFVDCHSVR